MRYKKYTFVFTLLALGTFAMLQVGCVNRVTMGGTNIKAIDLAIACQHNDALTQVSTLQISENQAYRRMSYVIKSAIYLDQKQSQQSEITTSDYYSMIANSGTALDEEEKAQFKKDAECFKHYFEEKRVDAGKAMQCSAPSQVSQAL